MYDFSVSPSGEEVISGSEDDTLRLWKLPESVVAKANLVHCPPQLRHLRHLTLNAFHGQTNEIVEIHAEHVWPKLLDGVMDMAQFVDDTTIGTSFPAPS